MRLVLLRRSILLLAVVYQMATVGSAFEPLFDSRIDYQVKSSPYSVCAADFDGDGKPDLAVAMGSNTVSVLKNNGDGTFAAAVNYGVGSYPRSVLAADFDGDGKPDLAVANGNSNSVSILMNNGDGSFADAVNYVVGSSPWSVFAADFDGDGKPDLAVANDNSNTVSILKNNGDGNFAGAVDYGVGNNPRSVFAADFDGDGKPDLAVANWSSNSVSNLMNNGDGSFAAAVDYAVGSNPVSVFGADFDGDAKTDLAVANYDSNTVSILTNNGDGTFADAVNYGIYRPASVCAADFDGDGKPDLALLGYGTSRVYIWKNNGDGTFAGGVNYVVGNEPMSVFAADFDEDGTPDIAVANSSNSVSTLMNNGDGTFLSAVNYPAGSYCSPYPNVYSIAATDFDGDGKPDLAVANNSWSNPYPYNPCANTISILKNNGDGTFASAIEYGVGSEALSVFSADFDGDGTQDIAVANYNSNSVSILKNNGNGTFASAVDYGVRINPYSVFSADFDGNGKPDLAVANAGSNSVSILKNNGNGTFASAVDYGVGNYPVSVFAADFDGDGKPDLAVANRENNSVSILKNNGSGTFASAVNYEVGNPKAVFAANFNQDGKLDLAVANNYDNTLSILMNNGNGTFAGAVDYGVVGSPVSVFAADFDGDGKPDLAVANEYGNTVSILISNGDGTFEGAVNYGVEVYPKSVYAGDFDGDGKPDLAVANYWFNKVTILKNRITGYQNHAPIITSSDTTSATEDARFLYRAAGNDPDGRSLTYSFIYRPSWLTSNADSIFGTPHYENRDTSFVVIASNGFLADTQIVCVKVHQLSPEITILRVDSDSLNLHVTSHAPRFTWHYFDPTGSYPQSEFEIAVGTDTDWVYSEMWNPLPFATADTFIDYSGLPLVDGNTYYLRLRVSNVFRGSEWFHTSFRMNSVPGVPEAMSPVEGQVVGSVTPELFIHNSSDPEGDALTYDFIVYPDTDIVLTLGEGIAQQSDSTGWVVDVALEENREFLWAARANDGYELSTWSPLDSFWVNATEQYPSAFYVYFPPDTDWAQVHDFPTTFLWGASDDPDPFDSVYYRLKIAIDSNFVFVATYDSIYQTTYDVPSLNYGTHYWWKVYAMDTKGNMTQSNNVADFMTWVLGDANADLGVNLADAVFLINYIFKGGYAPWPLKVGDVNGDCAVNLADAVYLINYVFKGGDPPGVGCVPEPVKAEGAAAKTSE